MNGDYLHYAIVPTLVFLFLPFSYPYILLQFNIFISCIYPFVSTYVLLAKCLQSIEENSNRLRQFRICYQVTSFVHAYKM